MLSSNLNNHLNLTSQVAKGASNNPQQDGARMHGGRKGFEGCNVHGVGKVCTDDEEDEHETDEGAQRDETVGVGRFGFAVDRMGLMGWGGWEWGRKGLEIRTQEQQPILIFPLTFEPTFQILQELQQPSSWQTLV